MDTRVLQVPAGTIFGCLPTPFFQGQGWHQGQASSVHGAHDGSGMLTLSSSGFVASACSSAASSSALSKEGRLSPRDTVEVSETVRALAGNSSCHHTWKLFPQELL